MVPLRKLHERGNGSGMTAGYAAMPNNLAMNFACPTTSSGAIRLTRPFLTIAIASIPRRVRQAVRKEL